MIGAENPPLPRAPHGRLLLCATPIGNLEDVTLRVLRALAQADLVACEDTRRTQILLRHHDITAKRLLAYHEHNERRRSPELLEQLRAGAIVALVSDAGTPMISDPGFLLVRSCLAEDITVEVLPGPSAVTAALVASGLPASRWSFVGFLPRKRLQRERLLRDAPDTLVAFESPHRLSATLDMLERIDPERPAAVCRELTKLHEEVARGSAAQLASRYRAHPPKGEIVLVVAPSPSK